MALANSSKGKRAFEDECPSTRSSSLSPVTDLPTIKRQKRAETRKCPVCDELIPIRLLAAHSELESERLEAIIRQVGTIDPLCSFDDGHGPSSRSRRSAVKARISISALTPRGDNPSNALIQTIERRRKRRHVKLREMTREEEVSHGRRNRLVWRGGEITCPVCLATVRGDQDVLDAHVDACLANESRRLEEERQREQGDLTMDEEDTWEEFDHLNETAGHLGSVRGTGFHTRDRNDRDVDDDVDVDGDDRVAFGDAQFTEGDILPVNTSHQAMNQDVGVEIEGDSEDEAQQERKTLRDLIAESKTVGTTTPGNRIEVPETNTVEIIGVEDTDDEKLAIPAARKRGNKSILISALENRIEQLESLQLSPSNSLCCRICLDPYDEPTVSTGCWHTCCRECWLRCLGSTKLCPICKRITGATDLRRIYL